MSGAAERAVVVRPPVAAALVGLWLLACGDRGPSVAPAAETPTRPAPEASPAGPSPESDSAPLAARTVVWVTGDVLMAEGIRRIIEGEVAVGGTEAEAYARILEPVGVWFTREPQAFVFANLESPVAQQRNDVDRSRWGGERPVAIPLNMPDYALEGLRRAGVDGLMLSNNHALDQGEEGLVETLAAARAAGFVVSGAGLYPNTLWPVTVGEDGARITLVPFYDGPTRGVLETGTPALSELRTPAIERFAALRAHTELLVAVVHVLGEAVDLPKPRWREWAQQLVEAGADLILVHGTHVPLPVEQLLVGERRVPIVWGLGNFVSDMARQASPRRPYFRGMPKDENPMLREGLLVRVELVQGRAVELSFLPTWMNDDRYVRFWGGFERQPRFRLMPLAACGQPIVPPNDWPPALRAEMIRWIAERRDHLVSHVGLTVDGCRDGEPGLLTARALRSRTTAL